MRDFRFAEEPSLLDWPKVDNIKPYPKFHRKKGVAKAAPKHWPYREHASMAVVRAEEEASRLERKERYDRTYKSLTPYERKS